MLAIPAAEAATYLGPAAVIASKDGTRLFVANADARQIAIVDAASGKVLQAVADAGRADRHGSEPRWKNGSMSPAPPRIARSA